MVEYSPASDIPKSSKLRVLRKFLKDNKQNSLHLARKYAPLVYTAQVNSSFRARILASSKVISQVLFTSEQPKKNEVAFVGILSQIKLFFGR